MTTVNEIMAEALKKADIGYSPTHIHDQPGDDASISPSARTAEAWKPPGITLSPGQLRARRARSVAIAVSLGAFVLMIFAVTIVRLGSGVLLRSEYMQSAQTTK